MDWMDASRTVVENEDVAYEEYLARKAREEAGFDHVPLNVRRVATDGNGTQRPENWGR